MCSLSVTVIDLACQRGGSGDTHGWEKERIYSVESVGGEEPCVRPG